MKHVGHGCPSIDDGRVGADARAREVHDDSVSRPVVAIDDRIGQLTPRRLDRVDRQHRVGHGGPHRRKVTAALTLVEALGGFVPAVHFEYPAIGPCRSLERDLHACPFTPAVEFFVAVADDRHDRHGQRDRLGPATRTMRAFVDRCSYDVV